MHDKWCEKRVIKVDLKTIGKKELNKILRKFYAEVKTEKDKHWLQLPWLELEQPYIAI